MITFFAIEFVNSSKSKTIVVLEELNRLGVYSGSTDSNTIFYCLSSNFEYDIRNTRSLTLKTNYRLSLDNNLLFRNRSQVMPYDARLSDVVSILQQLISDNYKVN